jgi:membrane protease YdiL (CAAX protease family)
MIPETLPVERKTPRRPNFIRQAPLLALLALIVTATAFLALGGYSLLGTLLTLLGVLVLVGLMRVLPPRWSLPNPLAQMPRTEVVAQVRPILVYAVLYPLLLVPVVLWLRAQALPLLPAWTTVWALTWNYAIVGKVALLFIPTIYFLLRVRGDARQLGVGGLGNIWRWVGPGVSAVALLLLPVLGFFVMPEKPGHGVPFGVVLAVWLVAFFGAGFPEEFFYRVLLQTRLELLWGRWNGLAVAALLFGLLHVPSRFALVYLGTTSSPGLDFAVTLAFVLTGQTAIGILLGYMWMRYRNAWVNVLLHTAYDALTFTAVVAGLITNVR